MEQTPVQIVDALARTLSVDELGNVRALLLLSPELRQSLSAPNASPFETACHLLLRKHEAADACDNQLLQATETLGDSWQDALSLVEDLEQQAHRHQLGYYILQAVSLRYACEQKRLYEARQSKF